MDRVSGGRAPGGIINEQVFLRPNSEVPNGSEAGGGRLKHENVQRFCGYRIRGPGHIGQIDSEEMYLDFGI